MKKFLKYVTLVLLLFVSISFVFAGCGKDNNSDNNIPASGDRIHGNGGLAVTKGEYLYFLNGYRSYSDVTKDEDNNKLSNHQNVVRGAIYKTKLSATGDLNVDEEGKIIPSSVERVVDRIACFENGGLYIVGDYLYYATPNTQDDRKGNLLNNYVDYCRVNLNNPSDYDTLYTSEGSVSGGEWAVYPMDGGIYLVINTGKKIVCVKNGDDAHTMVDGFDSVSLWDNEDSHNLVNHEKYVYYTKDGKINRVMIGTSNVEPIASNDSYTLVDTVNDRLYFTKSDKKLYVTTPDFKQLAEGKSLTQKEYTKTYVVNNYDSEATLNRVLVYQESGEGESVTSKLSYFDNGSWTEVVVYNGAAITILEVDGNYVYYLQSNSIYRLDIMSKESTCLTTSTESTLNFSSAQTMCFDVDGNYVYILNGYAVDANTVYYTERIDTNHQSPVNTFIGQFVDGEQPVETEDEE